MIKFRVVAICDGCGREFASEAREQTSERLIFGHEVLPWQAYDGKETWHFCAGACMGRWVFEFVGGN